MGGVVLEFEELGAEHVGEFDGLFEFGFEGLVGRFEGSDLWGREGGKV